jgi:glycosyltransferase involved in cell wall biosynthesis
VKILVASLFFPQFAATHAGGRFVAELVRELSKNHEVHLASRIEDTELDAIEEIRPFCKELHVFPYKKVTRRGLAASARLMASYLRFGSEVDKIIASTRFDLVQAEWVEAGMFLKKNAAPMVLDAHDVITKPAERALAKSRGPMRLARYLLYRVVRFLELRTVRKFDVIVTRAEYDKEYLRAMAKHAVIEVVPHPAGLDITGKTYERQKNTLLFLASFRHRRLNVDAALYFYRKVFPLVRARVPDAVFIIAGYGPPEELLSLGEQDPSVRVTGFVDDVDEYYKKAAVFVAPILVGGGIIVKVLDAMAAGTPVVTTSYGNEGIGAVPGRDLLIADSPDLCAEEVVKVLSDRGYADRIAENGRQYIRKHYGREAVFSRLDSIYRRLTAKAPG